MDENDKPRHAGGRPTDYRPEYAQIARAMCALGATDYELAQAFGVHTKTIAMWSCTHSEFNSALKVLKNEYDELVERRLAERAVGYTRHSEKIHVDRNGNVQRIAFDEHIPADPGAAKLWLTARKQGWNPDSGVTVTVNGETMSDDELSRRVAAILVADEMAKKAKE